MVPVPTRSSSTGASSSGAMRSNNFCFAAAAAVLMTGATDAVVWLPPLPPEGNPGSLSPTLTVISVGASPNSSATMIAIAVRMPVPISCVPVTASTVPSALMVTRASVPRPPPPPQRPLPSPMPRFLTPGPVPGTLFRRCHPISCAPRVYCACRTSLVSLMRRNSSGFIPSFSASSSMRQSIANAPCGCPGARIAR